MPQEQDALPFVALARHDGIEFVPAPQLAYARTVVVLERQEQLITAIPGILYRQHDKLAALACGCRQRQGKQNACRNNSKPPGTYIVSFYAGIHNLSLLRKLPLLFLIHTALCSSSKLKIIIDFHNPKLSQQLFQPTK